MPRFALALTLLAGCFFDADYSHAHLRCSDGKCPSGLTCYASTGLCGVADAAVGPDADAAVHDTHVPLLSCSDPGTALGTHTDSTGGNRTNEVSATCGGLVYNGPDAIYRIDGPRSVMISISGSYAVSAYVISTCTMFPTCEGNSAAQPAAPLSLTLPAGTHYVVVDGVNAGLSGTYTLTVQ